MWQCRTSAIVGRFNHSTCDRAANGAGDQRGGNECRRGPEYTRRMTWTEITTPEELFEIVGEPHPKIRDKARPALAPADGDWLAASPFCVVATADSEGNLDVSPKGDPAGSLVHVIDETTIAVAERPGNRRVDGYRNILQNPHVGMNFIIPARGETLRINGAARLVSAAPFLDEMIVKGQRPILALVVDIDEVFYHCAKALLRSNLWKPETWGAGESVPEYAKQLY